MLSPKVAEVAFDCNDQLQTHWSCHELYFCYIKYRWLFVWSDTSWSLASAGSLSVKQTKNTSGLLRIAPKKSKWSVSRSKLKLRACRKISQPGDESCQLYMIRKAAVMVVWAMYCTVFLSTTISPQTLEIKHLLSRINKCSIFNVWTHERWITRWYHLEDVLSTIILQMLKIEE